MRTLITLQIRRKEGIVEVRKLYENIFGRFLQVTYLDYFRNDVILSARV